MEPESARSGPVTELPQHKKIFYKKGHAMRSELANVSKKKGTMARTCLGCAFGIFVFFVLIGLITGVLFAQTGFVDFPFLTNALYRDPVPTRVVSVTSEERAQALVAFNEKLKVLFVENEVTRKKQSDPVPVDIFFTEQEFTAFLQSAIMRDVGVRIKNAQIAINPDEIEVYCVLTDESPVGSGIVLLGIKPVLSGSTVSIEITKMQIGGLKMPESLGNAMVNNFLSQHIAGLNMFLATHGTLHDVRLGQGTVEIRGVVVPQKKLYAD